MKTFSQIRSLPNAARDPRKTVRNAYIDMLIDQHCHLAITLNYYIHGLKPENAQRAIGKWLKLVDRKFLGRNFWKKKDERAFLAAFVHHYDPVTKSLEMHYHGVLRLPTFEWQTNMQGIERILEDLWRKVVPSGRLHLYWKSQLEHAQLDGFIQYAARELTRATEDYVVLSTMFHRD